MRREEVGCYEVLCGVDVGKDAHCCRAVARDGETVLLARTVGQDEGEISAFLSELSSIGRALVVVDQHGGFGALVVTLALAAGVDVARIPPSRFARASELYGEGKTDESDAMVLARLPVEAPRHVDLVADPGEEVERARVLVRYRHDIVCERTRAYNRVHDALGRCLPPLERELSGPALHTSLALAMLARWGASGLACARWCDVRRWARSRKGAGPAAEEAAGRIWRAARSQSAAMPAADVLDQVIMADAARIIELERLDDELSEQIAGLCAGLPAVGVLLSMPGVGEVYSRTIALEAGDVGRFDSASKLAAYCGVGKCPRESGKRRGRKRRRCYNRRLHAAVMESAKIAIRKPGPDRDYYEKKLAGGMNEHQALHALARKRVSIMYAMLKSMEPYRAA